MKEIERTIDGASATALAAILPEQIPPAKALVFDIETTGLSRERDSVYLIGCAYLADGVWQLKQFLAEKEVEERVVLSAFWSLAGSFEALLSYNGDRFDLPFLRERFLRYGINDILSSKESIDLYKHVLPMRSLLNLPDCKLKSVERFLGFEREDALSGKELIDVFKGYAVSADSESERLILQHNADDLEGLVKSVAILQYEALTTRLDQAQVTRAQARAYEDLEGEKHWELYMEMRLPLALPAPLKTHRDDCYLRVNGDLATLRVPLIVDELKYFYAGWRDYYYLPEEDTALHKSVAEYVDRSHREKATPATCYTRKYSQYLRQWDTLFEPLFRTSYEDHNLYFEITEERKKSRDDLSRYAAHVIRHIIA